MMGPSSSVGAGFSPSLLLRQYSLLTILDSVSLLVYANH